MPVLLMAKKFNPSLAISMVVGSPLRLWGRLRGGQAVGDGKAALFRLNLVAIVAIYPNLKQI
jgi:hypothetical protein